MRLTFVARVTYQGFTYQVGNSYDVADDLGRKLLDTFKGGEIAITDTLGARVLEHVPLAPPVAEGVETYAARRDESNADVERTHEMEVRAADLQPKRKGKRP